MIDRSIPDAAQRRRALDTRGSFIVQAPAGSGKTELLTQRYLRLLAEVRHPEEIYAITFTRKAAAEMRNRILAALDAATAPQPEAPHRRLTWQLACAALAQDRRHDWQLTANPNRLRIQTFDSLNHALARQMPVLSELGAPPATTDRPEALYRQAARATLRMLDDLPLGADLARLLTHLDNRQAQLEDLLTAMLGRRDQWLPHAVRSPDGDSIDAALEDAVTSHLQQLHRACPAHWLQQLTTVAQAAATRLRQSDPTTSDPGTLAAWHDRQQPPGTAWADLPQWLGLAELLLTKGREPRRSWNAALGFPAPSERGIDADARARRKQAKATISDLVRQLGEWPQALALWRGLPLLPRHGLAHGQRALLRSLLHVLRHAGAELQLVFQQQGEVDFSEIQMRAQRALGDPDEPTDLALSLDYRLRHLLVDEFQDTSSSQYRLLETLTAGWQAGEDPPRTLFVVGDPMQSIYRFREAEVGLYLAARDRGIGELNLTPLTLGVNFRSTAGVVDWVNAAFPTIFPQTIDIGRGAVPYSPAQAHDRSPDSLAVQVHPAVGDDRGREAALVVELVQRALTESDHGRIAVLARARSHLGQIALALKDNGLGFQAVDVDPLAGQPTVRDLYALTRALLHPGDRMSWLVVLRAPWLGLDLNDLLTIAEPTARSIPGRLREAGVRAALSDDGRKRVERLLGVIDRHLPARGRRRLRQWVEGIWLQLGGLAVAGESAAADADAYLGLLDTYEEAGGLMDFASFGAALESLYATPDPLADGRIQLMTMHKAKGLEFDTVILPGLGRRARGSTSELLYWLERTGSDGTPQLLMAPIRAADEAAEPISDYLRELDRDKQRLEISRLLYVAVTRARRRLHLLGHIGHTDKGPADGPASGSLLEQLWPAVEQHYRDLAAPPGETDTPLRVHADGLKRLAADWRPAGEPPRRPAATDGDGPPPATPIEFDWAGDTARHVGTLVHRHLERIASDGVEHWPATRLATLHTVLRRGLQNLGVAADELEAATAKAYRALQQTLDDERGRWILGRHTEARCEWPLTLYTTQVRHYVIDRSFVDEEGVRWIIDYKTGEHADDDRDAFLDRERERYRAQLENYARIVRQLEDRPIRLALYFPLFPDWRAWDYPA